MRKSLSLVLASGILLLFFIQLTGTLIESIYILDLLNTALDEKALGLLFFFAPVLLIFTRKPVPRWWVWLVLALLMISRGLTPYLGTSHRLLAAGTGTGAALLLLPFLFTARSKGLPHPPSGVELSVGLALAVGLSVLLRALGFGLDYSLTSGGGWAGWALGLLLGLMLYQFDWSSDLRNPVGSPPASAILGVFLVFTLVYFAFSAPAVISRWTSGNYAWITLVISLLSLSWVVVVLYKPAFLTHVPLPLLFTLNLVFTLAMTATLLAHRVPFPIAPESPPIVVTSTTWLQQIPLVVMLLSFPIIFVDLNVFARALQSGDANLRSWVPGMLLGSLTLIVLIFMNIFTNVWGYIEPVSPWFRNKYWLPFALLGFGLTLLTIRPKRGMADSHQGLQRASLWGRFGLLGVVFMLTVIAALRPLRSTSQDAGNASLMVMTYNIQQANDISGEKSYERQLALIQEISPDILALQENDSTRIGLNNNDYVRYFASRLGYYSYYGPSTVAGTYGTALLSRYTLQNPRTVFTFSDQDEIAITEAEIEVAGRTFTIYNVHPDGSDTALQVFAQTLLNRSEAQANVIALGDFNLRQSEAAYQMIVKAYTNAWLSVFPSGIDAQGLDMSGDKRIDHIFISPHLSARESGYRLPPESWTDHPVHWAEITWEK